MGVGGDGILIYCSRDTIHSSSHHHNIDQGHHGRYFYSKVSSGPDDDGISGDGSFGVSVAYGGGGFKYQ